MPFLEKLVVGDVHGIKNGSGTLSVFTNEKGGIIDDTVITKAGCPWRSRKHCMAGVPIMRPCIYTLSYRASLALVHIPNVQPKWQSSDRSLSDDDNLHGHFYRRDPASLFSVYVYIYMYIPVYMYECIPVHAVQPGV